MRHIDIGIRRTTREKRLPRSIGVCWKLGLTKHVLEKQHRIIRSLSAMLRLDGMRKPGT